MKTIFSQFADLLDVRFRKEIYTSEDAIRYTMFASMLYQDIPSDSLSFEYPHPTLDGAKIDTWFQIDGEKPIAIEFKYDRVIPSPDFSPQHRIRPHLVVRMLSIINKLYKHKEATL